MAWWDELWLNEGFARYIEYKGVHAAYPDWNMVGAYNNLKCKIIHKNKTF